MEYETTRLDDGTPYLQLGMSPTSKTLAFINVTLDF
jgi:hypothetical protein